MAMRIRIAAYWHLAPSARGCACGGQNLSIGTANTRCKSRDKENHLTIGEARLNDFMGRFVRDFGAAAHVKRSLKSDGAWMIVEPFANDRLEDNLNPVGRVFFAPRPLPLSARPLHVRRRSGCAWVRRPVNPAYATLSRRAASRISGAPPRHRSAWSMKHVPERSPPCHANISIAATTRAP